MYKETDKETPSGKTYVYVYIYIYIYIIYIYSHVYIYLGGLLELLPAAVPWRDRLNEIHIRITMGAYQCAYIYYYLLYELFLDALESFWAHLDIVLDL